MMRNSNSMMLVFNMLLAIGWVSAAVMTYIRHPQNGFLMPALFLAIACYYCFRTASKFKLFQQERSTR